MPDARTRNHINHITNKLKKHVKLLKEEKWNSTIASIIDNNPSEHIFWKKINNNPYKHPSYLPNIPKNTQQKQKSSPHTSRKLLATKSNQAKTLFCLTITKQKNTTIQSTTKK